MILTTDNQETKIKLWKAWIEYYWEVEDCRDLIPEEMLQRDSDKHPLRNRDMKMYGPGRNGEVLELLYELAKITGIQLRDAAWAKIGENWKNRRGGRNGNKALSLRDAQYALDHFRNLRPNEGERSTPAEEQLSSAATQSDKAQNQKEQKQEANQGA